MSTVALVVNGGPESAMGLRARAFAERLAPSHDLRLGYRTGGRLAALAAFRRMLHDFRPEVTWVIDLAVGGVVAAAWHRRSHPTRIILDTGDAIEALARSMGRSAAGVALTRRLEQFGLRTADRIVVRGTGHRDWLRTLGFEATVVPDGVETNRFAPRPVPELRAQLGLDGFLSIGLIGSSVWSPRLGLCYGWDLVELIGLLRDAPVKAVMIGDGSGIAKLRDRAAALGVADRVMFTGRLPYQELPAWLSAMDVCLSTQTNDLPGQVRTTGKLPLYLAAGRYILASRVGEAALVLPAEMLVDYQGTVDREYPARLAGRIRGLLANPQRLDLGRAGIEIARERFDYDVLARTYHAVIDAVAHAPTFPLPSSLS